jgi:Holliday junction resolvase-like predicted endonuclease
VDGTHVGIAACSSDLGELYAYVGLDNSGSMLRQSVQDALSDRISKAFGSGHKEVWRTCRKLEIHLIREHVMLGAPLEPYYQALNHLQSAVQGRGASDEPVAGNWAAAVAAALDQSEICGIPTTDYERRHVRDFTIARAAKKLRDEGFAIKLTTDSIGLEEASEIKLVKVLETFVAEIGGLNLARRIFAEISSVYDTEQQRYHIVPNVSLTGNGTPQTPWGYLLNLAVKHFDKKKPHQNSAVQWRRLLALATLYGAINDLQPYTHAAIRTFDASELIAHLQKLALYDSFFRMTQLRPSDVDRIARGMLNFRDLTEPTQSGWTVENALLVIRYLLDPARDIRGPIIVAEADVCRALPAVPKNTIRALLDDVLSHGPDGANRHFSLPTDAPLPQNRTLGLTFFAKPLLRMSGRRYLLIDRSVCAPAFLEALLSALREEDKKLDDKVGTAVERFLEAEFAARNVTTRSGDYDHGKHHGECDLVTETSDTLVFFELKKKALTRRAKAGSDADLLVDLAESLLAAQAQAGWHEVRIKETGSLNLTVCGITEPLALENRKIEKVAVSMLDYGSFQDRTTLKHFLESTLNSAFSPKDPKFGKKFNDINASLKEIRDQLAIKNPGQTLIDQPFFNCWFISMPQLLLLLDGVTDALSFHQALWNCRHIVTGTSDLYYEIFYMKKLRLNETALALGTSIASVGA